MKSTKEVINKLKQDILTWQGFKTPETGKSEALGLGEIEKAFPNQTFPKKAIHEFITLQAEQSAASGGFLGGLLSILMKDGAACVWISTKRKLFPASLRLFNVDPERIIFMDVRKEKDVLWVMEEALKCEGLAAVVAELNELSLIESRRLQLAAEQSGVTGFILRKDPRGSASSMVTARWKVIPLPSLTEDEMPGIGFPRWNVELSKVRNGNPGNWNLEWAGDGFAQTGEKRKASIWLNEKKRKAG